MQNLQKPIDQEENKGIDSSHSVTEGTHKHVNDPRTNEKFIQKVLEIEKHADNIHEKAVHEAEILPVQADQDAQTIVEKARTAAQTEAAQMVDQAKGQEQSADLLAEAEKNIQQTEMLASNNFNRAVAYVVARVIGRE